jgi:mRNA interferase MazF
MTTDISRGEIWWLDWSPGRGSEQVGRRPGLVVQSDVANHNPRYHNLIVVAVSSKGSNVPFHIALAASEQSGLAIPSYAKCEQLMTTSKDRLERRLGRVTEDELTAVDAALRLVLDL